LHFDATKAAKMGHTKPFLLNTGLVAFLPINADYFPFLDQPDHGVIGPAPKAVQDLISTTATDLWNKRPELIERRGLPLQPKRG
jgi:hypothetical protein